MAATSLYPSQFLPATATIIERFAETAFRASLPNGKITVAFCEAKNAHLKEILKKGDHVHVTICPADFNRARIDYQINDNTPSASERPITVDQDKDSL